MASSSSSPGIDQDLQALLDWVPPPLRLAQGRTRTKSSSKKPAFYDKHLSDRVVLKHVKSMPSLINDIAGIVDEKLAMIRDSSETLPPFGARVLTAMQLEWLTRSMMNEEIFDESSIAALYHSTTASSCRGAASTLALFPCLKTWDSVFTWGMSTANRRHAIAGGSLRIRRQDVELGNDVTTYLKKLAQEMRDTRDSMGEEMVTLLRDLKQKFPDLAVWEFKGLIVGDDLVMEGIKNEALTDIPFRWTRCESATYCTPRRHEWIELDVGPDANFTPWTIQPSISSGTCSRDDTSTPPRSATPEGPQRKRRKLDDGDASHKFALELTSESYLQQAWAEAVRANATLVILNSGNYEYVAIRNRATQTLHVSELFQPHKLTNPGYGKLHIGIYIAAYEDAVNRLRQIQLNPPSNSNSRRSGRDMQGGSERMIEKYSQTMELFSEHKRLLVYLQFGVYDSPVPATFLRVIPSASAKNVPPTPSMSAGKYMTLILSSKLGEGATGVAHGGKLEVETSKQHVTLDVVAKLAFSEDQRESLRHEYSIYCLLASKAVKHIPAVLGLFEDVEDCALALILTPAGVPIEGQLSTASREDFQAALAGIHHAGILHGDIRRQNLLINDSGEVAIIDFDQSRETSSMKGREQEMMKLVDLLG